MYQSKTVTQHYAPITALIIPLNSLRSKRVYLGEYSTFFYCFSNITMINDSKNISCHFSPSHFQPYSKAGVDWQSVCSGNVQNSHPVHGLPFSLTGKSVINSRGCWYNHLSGVKPIFKRQRRPLHTHIPTPHSPDDGRHVDPCAPIPPDPMNDGRDILHV